MKESGEIFVRVYYHYYYRMYEHDGDMECPNRVIECARCHADKQDSGMRSCLTMRTARVCLHALREEELV